MRNYCLKIKIETKIFLKYGKILNTRKLQVYVK